MQRLVVLLLFAAMAPLCRAASTAPCSASDRENCAYVSTLTDGKIYRFDLTTGVPTLIHDSSQKKTPAIPAAVTEGPDRALYWVDATNCGIFRLDPFASLAKDGQNSTLETVFASSSPCTSGITFDFNGHLTVNTAPFTGIFRIVKTNGGVAVSKVPLGQLGGTSAVSLVAPSGVGSTTGTGVIFSKTGSLLFAGQSADQILSSSVVGGVFGSPQTLISGLNEPIGLGQSDQKKIFVANHSTREILRCNSDGSGCSQFATFTSPDTPVYFDIDADGVVIAATEQIIDSTHVNGKLWRITGAGSCPGAACTLAGSIPVIKNNVPPGPAFGLSLSTTSAVRSATFGPGPDAVFGTTDDVNTILLDWDSHSLTLSYPLGVLTTHTVSVRAREVFPGDPSFASPKTTCNTYHGRKGKCVAYELIGSVPVKNVDFVAKYSIYVLFAGQTSTQPALLHDSRSLVDILQTGGPDFPHNIFNRYDRGPAGVDADPGEGGATDNFTAYVGADLGPLSAQDAANSVSYLAPLDPAPGAVTVAQQGRDFPVKLEIKDPKGKPVLSATVVLGVSQLVNGQLVPTAFRSNTNEENLFRIQSNVYIYTLDTSNLPAGLFVLTAATTPDSLAKITPIIALLQLVN
jgi:hypothetical protein